MIIYNIQSEWNAIEDFFTGIMLQAMTKCITFILQRDQTNLNSKSEIANVKRKVSHLKMSNVH